MGLDFPDTYSDILNKSPYPASAQYQFKVTPQLLMKINRDHYQNTKYDMEKGPASGP